MEGSKGKAGGRIPTDGCEADKYRAAAIHATRDDFFHAHCMDTPETGKPNLL
jgi:hypothetical protein